MTEQGNVALDEVSQGHPLRCCAGSAGGPGVKGGDGFCSFSSGPGHFVPSGLPVREHRLKVGAKLTKGFLAWRAPSSPLREGPPLETGVWHHIGCFEGFDHLACVGWTHLLDVSALQGADSTLFWNAPDFYMDLIEMLHLHTSTPAMAAKHKASAEAGVEAVAEKTSFPKELKHQQTAAAEEEKKLQAEKEKAAKARAEKECEGL